MRNDGKWSGNQTFHQLFSLSFSLKKFIWKITNLQNDEQSLIIKDFESNFTQADDILQITKFNSQIIITFIKFEL